MPVKGISELQEERQIQSWDVSRETWEENHAQKISSKNTIFWPVKLAHEKVGFFPCPASEPRMRIQPIRVEPREKLPSLVAIPGQGSFLVIAETIFLKEAGHEFSGTHPNAEQFLV